MKEIPELSMDMLTQMEDMSWFTHAQIFDDLLIVAQKETSCYIWKTADGLVIFDAIWPNELVYQEIMAAIHDAGWDDSKISKLVFTHGHVDHLGCVKWLLDNHAATTFLSEADDNFRKTQSSNMGQDTTWKTCPIDRHINDGDVIACGDKQIQVVATPGHTPGCMSFIFPVFENGEKHTAALLGGSTPPWNGQDQEEKHRQSIVKFKEEAKKQHADVALTNHTRFDCTLERIAYSQQRMVHLPNIYIIGEDATEKFWSVFQKIAI